MYKIFVVEDDSLIRNQVKNHLEKWDYQVLVETDFMNIMQSIHAFKPDLILLDILLPFKNGYHWCLEIRKYYKTPIIFISSANENMNIIMAMDLGGDDFITKPFDLTVLSSKIAALKRRTYSFKEDSSLITYNSIILNLGNLTLSFKEYDISLTKNEMKILQVLFENGNNVVSRETIMIRLWDSEHFIDDNPLSLNIARLRKKLEDIGLTDFILTKKNMGYCLK